jgi:hypothetical protein
MVIGFPPTPDEMAYVADNCLKYVRASGPLDIGRDFEAVDALVLLNLTRSPFRLSWVAPETPKKTSNYG